MATRTSTTTRPPLMSGFDATGRQDARTADFMGEGLEGPAITGTATASPEETATIQRLKDRDAATATANINSQVDPNASQASTTAQQTAAYQSGNTGGAAGAYNATTDAGRAQYDYMHDLGKNDLISNPREFINSMGEEAGVSHAGDAATRDAFTVQNPLDFNPVSQVVDPNTGLGTTAGGGLGGKPVGSLAPEAAALAGQGIVETAAGGVGDALDAVLGGPGGGIPVDASGADRGGMGLGGAYSTQLDAAAAQGANARQLGTDVLSGNVAAPNAADAARQGDALDRAMGFLDGPRATNDVMGRVNAFAAGPEGPSQAQLLLDDASQKAMADVLSASRSGRARDAGSQARAAHAAQADIAGMGVDNARSAGLLRAKEANDARSQTLQALGLSGNLAQGLDANTLQALGMGGDIAGQMRSAGIQERGQGLDFMQGQEQIGAGLTGDVLKTIPQLENIRHQDQFELTPQQKLAAASIGQPPDPTTADKVMALLGDVFSAL